jgi:hypothetical protein
VFLSLTGQVTGQVAGPQAELEGTHAA